ncbi:MAG TPA: PAS domain S-box protein [Pyrinomonadaceae bacterium]|nr:PAS domain S-box protein [Pyrinomonadaceae bacterium]
MPQDKNGNSLPAVGGPITRPQSPDVAAHWLKAVIDSADDAVITKTLEGVITSWNPGAQRVFGYTADEAIGKPVTMLIPEDHIDEEPTILSRIRAGERIEHYETVRRRKDGTLIDISLTVSPIRDSEGHILGASKIARDISPRKRAERALAQISEESGRLRRLYDTALSNTPDLVYVFDREGRFIYANEALLATWGKTWEEAAGKRCLELGYEPWHAAMHEREIREVVATRSPLRGEVPFTGTQGRRVYEYIFAPVFGADGEVEAVAGTTRDITDRKRMEEERERLIGQLEWERSRLSYLFTKAPAFIATMRGPEHIIEMTNPAYLRLVGRREVVGKPAREALPEVAGQGFFELLDGVYETGEPFEGREMLLTVQGERGALEERFIDFVYQPIKEADGTVSGVFAHGVDITEQVMARRQSEEANRLKDEFLATVSHELRTPLTAILGWAHMLRTGQYAFDARAGAALETIERNARAQAQIIEDLLDVSRIITGKLRLDVRAVAPDSFIDAAVEAVRPAAEAKGVRVQKLMDAGLVSVSGDPVRLQQVVWNLLSNAIKFTPSGGRVQIRMERAGSQIEIAVGDTGAGIAPDFLPHVFDRFRQADGRTTRRHGGLGLGLAIVRHLVELHGGTVRAESEGEGHGSTFTVTLPAAPVYPSEQTGRVQPPARESLPFFECPDRLDGLRVLVVDDEPDARELLKAGLGHCGASVSEAASAAEALASVEGAPPDLLISDIGMPGEDGYSLIRKVRSLPAERGGRVPAIALTAYARAEDRMQALRAGYQMHVPKPVELVELAAVAASLVRRDA